METHGDVCARPVAGSLLPEPADLRSKNGVLDIELVYTTYKDDSGRVRYCYHDRDGDMSPNLRVHQGDWVVLKLKNELRPTDGVATSPAAHAHTSPAKTIDASACGGGLMDGLSTNLHFHGVSIPPVCHQDDAIGTLIAPSDQAFEYRFQIPADQPPGIYWYHPHVHGFSSMQLQGGASGALIVEGIERAKPIVAELPERVLIVRDEDLNTPNAVANAMVVMPQIPPARDPDGDILNTGTGSGVPSKDLSLNFVPVSYPNYSPALLITRPGERQLWRVLNACAITYLDLQVLYNGVPQMLGVVALDGVPVEGAAGPQSKGGANANGVRWQDHVSLPPGSRAEFIFQAPPDGVYGNLITRAVDTGPMGENDPIRPLANIIAKRDAREPGAALPKALNSASTLTPVHTDYSVAALRTAAPVRERKLYFSEEPSDPKDPNSKTVFMVTVDGDKPAPYDPVPGAANITVHQGDVEDWIVENRSQELHDFHIHQIHFLVMEVNGAPADPPELRDTVNVDFWDGKSKTYPSVKLRMDFRNPRVVGTFVYHCHILEHEDGGMMGTIQVMPSQPKKQRNE